MTQRTDPPSPQPSLQVNPGYVLGQLSRALTPREQHESAEVRERAEQKVDTWRRVFQGMLDGSLQVGSRTPVSEVPAWATLRVTTGGFATGELLAEGPLAPHERQWLEELDALSAPNPRAVLNAYFLGEPGQEVLARMLSTGAYRLDVPEEGALLAVTWLLRHAEAGQARALLEALGPFLGRLRFYPVPHPASVEDGLRVRLQTVEETRAQLAAVRPRPEVERQRETLLLWHPLYDRLVQLFMETRTPQGAGQHFPSGWHERARSLRHEIVTARGEHPSHAWTHKPTSHFGKLFTALEVCLTAHSRLTPGQCRQVGHVLDAIAQSRGLPGSERAQRLRTAQERVARLPTPQELARVLIDRLRERGAGEGLDSLEQVSGPITAQEGARHRVPEGTPVPPALERKLRRCVEGSLEELVSLGMVTSSEVLARVLPQVSSHVSALGITDPELRRLYGQLYAAFRRRRSLLLLNLQSQVKLQELPWVRVLEAHRTQGLGQQEVARQTLERVTTLAVTAFPESLLPNKLLQELRALAQAAGLKLPLVEELAADIFMGAFSGKFLEAARQAAALLEGTLYARYYALPVRELLNMKDVAPSVHGTPTSPAFAALCIQRANEDGSAARSVAANGRVIEQAQILTTHNLAVLFQELELGRTLAPQLTQLARRCYQWLLARLQVKTDSYQARLRHLKNCAYAWRQMVFFLSLVPDSEQARFLEQAEATLRSQPLEFIARFAPALERLRARMKQGPEAKAGHVFLGWTVGKHWLLSKP